MATIQKRADELKPGDYILGASGKRDGIVIWVRPMTDAKIEIQFGVYGSGTFTDVYRSAAGFDVQQSELTLAQQHAEELEQALRTMMDCYDAGAQLYNDHHDKFTELLNKIKPPEPPTLEEALKLLEAVRDEFGCGEEYGGKIDALVESGRRAGVLK